MASPEVVMVEEEAGFFTNPMPWLAAAMGLTLVAWVIALVAGNYANIATLLILTAGAVAAGGAVAIRPQSAAVLGLAAVVALLAGVAFGRAGWDTAAMLFRVLLGVALVCAILVLLPSTARRVFVSLLIVWHFGGIVSSVTSAPALNGPGAWLSNQLYTYVYRPYLEFMYLTNAYHFYAPEPGPAPLLWFCIEYQPDPDGHRNWRWVKVPDFDKDGHPVRPDHRPLWPNLEYTRRLSLAESVNFPGPSPGPNFQEMLQRRVAAGRVRGIPIGDPYQYPIEIQFREPNFSSKRAIAAYARHVARRFPHETKPQLAVIGVKVYRVTNIIALPQRIAQGITPIDESLYLPYYQGEFDKDGNPKPYLDPDGAQGLPDPFLYWLIPIQRELVGQTGAFRVGFKTEKIKNYVLVHAGVEDEGVLP
jgi:hypothetical protein